MSYSLDSFKELDSLSEDERKLALEILGQFSKNGSSDKLDKILYEDYEEIPVDIETFLRDPNYLGKGLINEEGKFTVFPYWVETLKKVFPNNIDTNYRTFVLSGAIGLGKSFVAVLCMLYQLYRMMCLKDPYIHYGLQPIDKITFAFMNITLEASKGVAWDKCQQLLQLSPWFMARGTLTGTTNVTWTPPKGIELIAGSLSRHIIGRAVFGAFFDEISFQPNQDIEKQKIKAKTLVSTASARMESRFMKGEKNPTLLILASSKRTEQSFLETFIENKKKNDRGTTLVIDEPQWVIRTDKDSPNKFKVALGNKFLNSEVLPLDVTDDQLKTFRDKGYRILEVPMGYYESFIDDLDIALTDIAGISTTNSTKYISGPRLLAIKKDYLKNPFIRDVIVVGNAPDDKTQYWDFFDLANVDPKLKSRPLYIHLDMSISGDKTGIAGTWIVGKKPPKENEPQSKELFYRVAFAVSIKAPKGYQISFEKNRQFIYWLKSQGFNIKGISTDTFQSADLAQQLIAKGYNYSTISVDRVDSDHICKPYQYLKSTIYEERIETFDSVLMTEEFLGLERDGNGKINHPDGGTTGCFTGDTKISLVDGRELSLIDLVKEYESGKRNYVYSFNEYKKIIEPKLIEKAWCTIKNAKLIEVELDDGGKIRCTPNHKFMLRDGSYLEAKDLSEGDSLMPLYRKYPNSGQLKNYRLYYEPIEDKWHYEHRRFAIDVFDEKHLVHHENMNPKDNSPDNLIWMSKKAHIDLHNKLLTGANSLEAREKKSKSLSNYYSNNRNSETFINRNKKISETLKNKIPESVRKAKEKECLDRRKRYLNHIEHAQKLRDEKKEKINLIEKIFNVNYSDLSHSEKDSLGVKLSRMLNPDTKKKIIDAVIENHKNGKYVKAEQALAESNKKSKELKSLCPEIDFERFKEIFGFDLKSLESRKRAPWYTKYRRIVCKDILNHKVKSIKLLDECEDVYDLTIQDNHNFALACGVFVHNSKDMVDAICGSVWNASQNAEQFAFDYGETLDTVVNVSNESSSYEGQKQQVVLDLEQGIQQLLDPRLKNIQKQKNAETSKQENQENKSKPNKNPFLDFGMGPAEVYKPAYFNDGIVWW